MRLTFWGVRGSVATPEVDNERYGGNTPCVEIRLSPKRALLLDAGLGLRWQSNRMLNERSKGNQVEILLSHCHWDHIQGIPFSPMMYLPDNQVVIHGAGYPTRPLLDNLMEQLRPEFCPVPNFFRQEIGAHVRVEQLTSDPWFNALGCRIRWGFLPRGRSATHVVGYRIESKDATITYLTDVEYPDGPEQCKQALELARDTDVLIHDAQFLPDERAETLNRGHSNYEDALRLARIAGARRLLCTHHDPSRSDRELDEVASWLRQLNDVQAEVAHEGLQIQF
ncbi:MBL fold metallo-hydrolase [bacterium]|nr:MBL fold metallo-hydrolase [bacterium]